MQTDKYKKYTATDFLKDKVFIRWQLFNDEKEMLFFKDLLKEYPELQSPIEEAIGLYNKGIHFNDFKLSDSEISASIASLQKQFHSLKRKRTQKRIVLSIYAVAASVAIILSLPRIFHKSNDIDSDISTFVHSLPSNNDNLYSSDTKLIVSESKTIILDNSESYIQYQEDGVIADDNIIQKEEAAHYNQLITPYGKRSVVTFSDGTKVWVNAGSKLVYPSEFNKKKREIYVDGEIYIEVAEEKKRPFIIKTSEMNIQVLGTTFNVLAYESDNENSVVLVSGSVSISHIMNSQSIVLKPDQKYSDTKGNHIVETVDANLYISWTHGLYQFESEKFVNIARRLERYYGIRMKCDPVVANLKCSGKLDLKYDMNKLLEDLSQALPITYWHNPDGSYTVNSKYLK